MFVKEINVNFTMERRVNTLLSYFLRRVHRTPEELKPCTVSPHTTHRDPNPAFLQSPSPCSQTAASDPV